MVKRLGNQRDTKRMGGPKWSGGHRASKRALGGQGLPENQEGNEWLRCIEHQENQQVVRGIPNNQKGTWWPEDFCYERLED